ncbi:MAG: DUF1330 domain-containing protein [Pseudomonadota bacterium]
MPAGYLIGHITVTNPEAYKEYVARVPAIIEAHGGHYLVRGGAEDTVEGEPAGKRHVCIAFPSFDAVKAFYNSPEYREIIELRTANSTGSITLVEGV